MNTESVPTRRVVTAAVIAVLAVALWCVSAFGQGFGSERVVKGQAYASTDGVRPGDKFKIAVALQIADQYHVNAHVPSMEGLVGTKVEFQAPNGITIGDPLYPNPEEKSFSFAPDTRLSVYEGTVYIVTQAEASKQVTPGDIAITASVDVQSCNDSQCLMPSVLHLDIPVKIVAAGGKVAPANAEVFSQAAAAINTTAPAPASPNPPAQSAAAGKGTNQISNWITKYGLGVTLLLVFLSGLALNTTPCVYPIIPITIGFFANQSASEGHPRLRRTFSMACMYVLGMAITYSILGVIASLTGSLFGSALQKPAVLIGLAVLMVALSLSMFGLYEFRLPESFNRFATSSTQSTGGLIGALIMGLTMGIVAAPCIGPFVLGLIVHVADKGSPVYGFLLFFVLSIGLGAPYLILGTFSGAMRALPRSGMWMVTVRKVFGLILIGMAIYFLLPLLGSLSTPILVAFFGVSAAYLIFWESGRTKPTQFAWVLRLIGVGAVVAAIFLALPKKMDAEIPWQPYSDQAVQQARQEGKAVIIDTYADWCIPCRELDKRTFTDAAVRKEAGRFVVLKLNLTHPDSGTVAKHAADQFDIRGVPTVLFLDSSGQEQKDLRLNEFEKPDGFLARMKQVASSLGLGSTAEASTGADATPAGGALPDVSIKKLDGTALDLQAQRGKVLVIDFWATWCVPCMSEIPIFNTILKEYQARGVEIIAPSTDQEGAAKVKPFVKQHNMNYTIATADETAAKAFGVGEVLPVTLIVDKQGRIRFSHTGITEKDKLQSEIDQLLKE
jgi:thiol:disulfide interchange protein DsbD